MRNGKGKPNPRRAELKALSAELRPYVKAKVYENMNEALIAHYTKQTGAREWRTFNGWKEAGQIVMKGQHGFPIWGTPRNMKAPEGAPMTDLQAIAALNGAEPTGPEFFPVCYLFHNEQVRPADQGAHSLALDLEAA